MKTFKETDIPHIKKVMTPFPYSIESDQGIVTAKQMMDEHDIRHLPVTKGGDLFGIISDRDIRLSIALGERYIKGSQMSVDDVCTLNPYTVDLNTRLDVVLMEMARNHYGSALVTKNGKLAGIFTTTDACLSFGEMLFSIREGGGDPQAA